MDSERSITSYRIKRVSLDNEDDEIRVVVKPSVKAQLEERILEKTRKFGVTATYVIKAALFNYYSGNNRILPNVVAGLVYDEVRDYVIAEYSKFTFTSIGELAIYTDLLYMDHSHNHRVLHVTYPIVRKTRHVARELLKEWNIAGSGGLYPHTSHISGLIDYVVPKQDGILFESVILHCHEKNFTVCYFGGMYFELETQLAITGEMCDNKIYIQAGYELRNVPSAIRVAGEVFDLIKPGKMVPNLVSDKTVTEGCIVSVSGVEHKIKYINTVDLELKDDKLCTGDINKRELNVAKHELKGEGIVECEYDKKKNDFYPLKIRKDKIRAQRIDECATILNGVTVGEFVAEFGNVPTQHLGNTIDVLPTKEVQKIIVETGISVGGLVTKERIHNYANSKKKFVTTNQIFEGLAHMGVNSTGIMRLNADDYGEVTSYVPSFASRYEIWNFARQTRVRLLPLDFCIACATYVDKRVNMAKVMGLVSTNDLMYVNNMISVKIYNGKIVKDKLSKSYCPPIAKMSSDDFCEAVVNYLKFNYGKFIHEDVVDDFIKGSFLGDDNFVFNLVKCILFQVGGNGPFIDVGIWRRVMDLPGIREKMTDIIRRYEAYDCIGDHNKEHVCSNGTNWRPEDEIEICKDEVRELIELLSDEFVAMDNFIKCIDELGMKVSASAIRSEVFCMERAGKLVKREYEGVFQWKKTVIDN